MAYKGKLVNNHKTGQQIEFITTAKDSNGKLLEMVTTYKPYSTPPIAHYHPVQHEYFTVLQGELTVQLKNDTLVLKKGDSIDIPANTIHNMWNNSAATTVVSWKVVPAMQTEYFLETAIGLVEDNKTNDKGVPGILQFALMAGRYSNELRLAKPSYIIQKILFGILRPIALIAGKKAVYSKYID